MIVFTADLHLTPLTWVDQPEMRGDAYVAWMQIVDFCVKHHAEALLIGGDIFDKTRPDSESVDVFETGMARLAEEEILVYFTQGQHDRAVPPWASALSPLAKYIGDGQPAIINLGGEAVVVCGYDNMSAPRLRERLEALEEPPHILLIHQLEKTFVPYEDAWDFDMEWVHPDIELVLGGDYHDPVEVGRLWYTGSTYSCNITQFGPRSFLTIDRDVGGKLYVEREPLDKRDVIELTIITDAQLDDAVKAIKEFVATEHVATAIETPLVFARYSMNVTNALPVLEDTCQEAEYILRTKALAGGVEIVGEIPKLQGVVSLDSCLSAVVDREADEEFYSFALALLKAPDPKDALIETKARLGVA